MQKGIFDYWINEGKNKGFVLASVRLRCSWARRGSFACAILALFCGFLDEEEQIDRFGRAYFCAAEL